MKKVLTLITFAGMFAFTACGPSQADLDKKAKERHDSDSMATANQAAADAAKMQHEADSVKMAEESASKMKMMADSLHQDSIKRKLIKVKK
jgi:hypothetical protein